MSPHYRGTLTFGENHAFLVPKMGARIWAKKEIGSMGAGFGFACCVLALGFFTLELMFQLGLALSWDR